MVLSEWMESQPKGVLTRLARDSGLAYTTVFFIAHGGAVRTLETARKLSEATGGEVSVEEAWFQSLAITSVAATRPTISTTSRRVIVTESARES